MSRLPEPRHLARADASNRLFDDFEDPLHRPDVLLVSSLFGGTRKRRRPMLRPGGSPPFAPSRESKPPLDRPSLWMTVPIRGATRTQLLDNHADRADWPMDAGYTVERSRYPERRTSSTRSPLPGTTSESCRRSRLIWLR